MLLVLDFPVQSASQIPLHCLNVTILMVLEKTDNICCNCNVDRVFRGWRHIHSPAISSVTTFMLSKAGDNEVGGL